MTIDNQNGNTNTHNSIRNVKTEIAIIVDVKVTINRLSKLSFLDFIAHSNNLSNSFPIFNRY